MPEYRAPSIKSFSQKQEDARQVSDLADQVQEAETRLKRAETAASILRGTPAEHSSAADFGLLQTEAAVARHALGVAVLQHGTLETTTRLKATKTEKEIAAAEAELGELHDRQHDLQDLREETHIRLGQAVRREIVEDAEAFKAHEQELDELLASKADCQADFTALQHAIKPKLADCPGLLQEVQEAYGLPPPPSPLQRQAPKDHTRTIFDARMAYVNELLEHRPKIECLPIQRPSLIGLVAVSPGDVQILIDDRAAQEARRRVMFNYTLQTEAWLRNHPFAPPRREW